MDQSHVAAFILHPVFCQCCSFNRKWCHALLSTVFLKTFRSLNGFPNELHRTTATCFKVPRFSSLCCGQILSVPCCSPGLFNEVSVEPGGIWMKGILSWVVMLPLMGLYGRVWKFTGGRRLPQEHCGCRWAVGQNRNLSKRSCLPIDTLVNISLISFWDLRVSPLKETTAQPDIYVAVSWCLLTRAVLKDVLRSMGLISFISKMH